MDDDYWGSVTPILEAPLSADAVKPAPKGKFGEYVEGLHSISEANRIFGFGGWSYVITRLEQVSEITTDKNQYRCGWMCTVRVNARGAEREGAAVGNGSGKPDNMADVIESAVKEAETDALKRALRSFGNTFGLALYEKDLSKRQVEQPKTTKEKVEGCVSADDVNGLIQECSNLGDTAKKALMDKAISLGLNYDRSAGKFVAGGGNE